MHEETFPAPPPESAQGWSSAPAVQTTEAAQDRVLFRPADPSWAPPLEGYPGPEGPGQDDLDPTAATGPPWPRLVATGGDYSPPRLLKWPIVVGALLLIFQIASSVATRINANSNPPNSAPPYVLTATDAQFTATFPGKPTRTVQNDGLTSVIGYFSTLSDHVVGVTYVSLPDPGAFNLDDAINGGAEGVGGTVLSRTTVSYRGQRAEDADISITNGTLEMRAVVIGTAGYLLEGGGASASAFAKDYHELLATFSSSATP